MGSAEKPVAWVGSSYRDVRSFPADARRRAGYELYQAQKGTQPSDWKPVRAVGPGAYEIRMSTGEHGGNVQHRIFYVAKFEEAVYVLHAFRKSTRRTSRHDLEVGRRRYAEMIQYRSGLEVPHGK